MCMYKGQYLFLFPIKEHLSSCDYVSFSRKGDGFDSEVKMLNDIIEARYGRGSGYEMNWLMFSSPQNRCEPNLGSIDARMLATGRGRMLSAGVTFMEHTTELKYFDPDFVLSQMPNARRLVVGGFQDCDCVERIAKAAHAKGLDASIDEDTTDMFFNRRALGIKIPLKRREWSLEDFGMTTRQGAPQWMIDIFKDARRGKPYRVKV